MMKMSKKEYLKMLSDLIEGCDFLADFKPILPDNDNEVFDYHSLNENLCKAYDLLVKNEERIERWVKEADAKPM